MGSMTDDCLLFYEGMYHVLGFDEKSWKITCIK